MEFFNVLIDDIHMNATSASDQSPPRTGRGMATAVVDGTARQRVSMPIARPGAVRLSPPLNAMAACPVSRCTADPRIARICAHLLLLRRRPACFGSSTHPRRGGADYSAASTLTPDRFLASTRRPASSVSPTRARCRAQSPNWLECISRLQRNKVSGYALLQRAVCTRHPVFSRPVMFAADNGS